MQHVIGTQLIKRNETTREKYVSSASWFCFLQMACKQGPGCSKWQTHYDKQCRSPNGPQFCHNSLSAECLAARTFSHAAHVVSWSSLVMNSEIGRAVSGSFCGKYATISNFWDLIEWSILVFERVIDLVGWCINVTLAEPYVAASPVSLSSNFSRYLFFDF